MQQASNGLVDGAITPHSGLSGKDQSKPSGRRAGAGLD
jgi:hypothetical protein